MAPCGLGEYYTILHLMETQLGASRAGCLLLAVVVQLNRQQKENNRLFYLTLRKDKLGYSSQMH